MQEVLLTEVILEMVMGGLGIAALPRWAVVPQMASGMLCGVPLEPPGYRWQWSVAQVREGHRPAYIEEFIGLMADPPAEADFFHRTAKTDRNGHRAAPRRTAQRIFDKRLAANRRPS